MNGKEGADTQRMLGANKFPFTILMTYLPFCMQGARLLLSGVFGLIATHYLNLNCRPIVVLSILYFLYKNS